MGTSAAFRISDEDGAAILTLRCQMDGQPTATPTEIFSILEHLDLSAEPGAIAFLLIARLHSNPSNTWRLEIANYEGNGDEEWFYELYLSTAQPPRLAIVFEGEGGSGTLYDSTLSDFTPTTALMVEAAAAQLEQ
jgi:hypothetical protein